MVQARRSRFWERAAPALRVAGAILLAAGLLHLYAEIVIFDARAFGARAALSLGDPRVAGFVAERLTDEAIAQRRDLMAYRPLLVGTGRTIVSSEPFRAGFRRAAPSAHAALFSESAERVAGWSGFTARRNFHNYKNYKISGAFPFSTAPRCIS